VAAALATPGPLPTPWRRGQLGLVQIQV